MTVAKIPQYWKGLIAWVAVVVAVGTQVVQATLADGTWTMEDTIVAAVIIAGAFGVVVKGNAPA